MRKKFIGTALSAVLLLAVLFGCEPAEGGTADLGDIRFDYPAGWTLTEEAGEAGPSATLQFRTSSYVMVMIAGEGIGLEEIDEDIAQQMYDGSFQATEEITVTEEMRETTLAGNRAYELRYETLFGRDTYTALQVVTMVNEKPMVLIYMAKEGRFDRDLESFQALCGSIQVEPNLGGSAL